MKKAILFILISSISILAQGQSTNCSGLKSGVFRSDTNGQRIIERKAGKEIFTFSDYDLKLEFDIEWLNNCSYKRKLSRILKNPNNEEVHYSHKWTIVKLIDGDDSGYIERLHNEAFNITVDLKWTKEN
ncbi:hypothetical protein PXD56_06610 [Maribacter sp. SA7]|uniref:hypothetical protein n=1 Tax=Maribacter zhoushanensis TaxID=3030012 RepID=UPI0023EAD01A|nr:hypothetical protein [Maribacter zhoushanensis]MDF4202616.1 hypothetical protein [Maribacter zhoushanensis]